MSKPAKPFCPFPDDFLWGAATAAYQVEGAAAEGGRSPSVWDTFSRRPGAVADDHNGDVACDQYHRYEGDVALMKDLGLKAYRFSVSWPRVFPDDSGKPNAEGVDYYKRLCDALLAAGIEPWMTLFHWDLPQWAEDKWGGWESKECAQSFAEYAGFMAKALGDRVKGVFTINEFMCYLDKAYTGNPEPFAPGKVVSRKVFNQSRHHAVLAHGLAVQAVRAAAGSLPVGLAENAPAVVPILETPEHIAAAKEALREMSGMYLTPILEGAYHPRYLEEQDGDAPTFTDAEMKAISEPIDFVGLNVYAPSYVRADADSDKGWAPVPLGGAYPRMHMPWLAVGPAITYWSTRLVSELWGPKAIYFTENGCANPDRPDEQGEILDVGRVMYLQEHLVHASRAAAEGYPLKGYFLWSLLDNFEWACGYTRRFGIHYVNYQTQERTPKLSAEFYKGVIARNAVGGA